MESNKNLTDAGFAEALVAEVMEDFNARRAARRPIEAQWELNMEFLAGRQFASVTAVGDVEEEAADYYWQSRNVYNHILPVIDTRLAKLAKVRPVMSVRAASEDDADIYTAQLATKLLNSTYRRLELDEEIASATRWSEVAGTAFYRIGWNAGAGRLLGELDGEALHEGDAEVEIVSPFEIFPDSLSRESVADCDSIIRARVVKIADIKTAYGVDVGAESDVYTYSTTSGKTCEKGCVLLIERFEKPCAAWPQGRIVTVAGGRLLSVTELPFFNGADGERTYPFIKQTSHSLPGSFFGTGIIDRLIPVQRAYNAVRNRKHEFMNRIAMGVLTVEDGSLDAEALAEEGLQPGRIIVYRQGSEPPKMMEAEKLPADFEKEEEKLLEEFVLLGGVNEVSQNYKTTLGVTSAAGLQILLEQDDERLTVSAENIRRAVKETAKHLIRLFKQFTVGPRLMSVAGDSGAAELFYFTAGDITSDDVVFETENELSYSPSQRRSNVLEIIASGILADEKGRINRSTKTKLLELMGFGGLEDGKTADAMHTARAEEENVTAGKIAPVVETYDDHYLHIAEHTRFLVGKGYTKFDNSEKVKKCIEEHLNQHKAMERALAAEAINNQEVPQNT